MPWRDPDLPWNNFLLISPIPMTVARRITLQDIADKAGVSKATVSRALRDHSTHSAATKQKIAAAAKELGYEAYPILSAVMASVRFKRTTQVSPVIAEIHCQPAGYDREGNPASLRKSIHEQAEKLGFRVEEFHWYERGLTPRRLINIVRARGIRAVIFEHFMEHEVSLTDLPLDGLAMVSIGGAQLRPKLHRVEINHYGNLIQAVKILQGRGYRRFGVIIPPVFEQASDFKRSAALYSQDLRIQKRDQIPVFQPESHSDLSGLAKWLKRYRPDCVLGVGKTLPEQLDALGRSFPKDVGYVHLGWHPSYRPIAGMNPKWNEAGRVAVNLIVDQLTRNEHGVPAAPLWILIEGEWIEGTSVRSSQQVGECTPRTALATTAPSGNPHQLAT